MKRKIPKHQSTAYKAFEVVIPSNSDNKPWAYICSKSVFDALIFGGAYFHWGLLLEGILRFKCVGLDNKSSLKQYENSLNNLKELTLRFHGLISGRAYYRKDICIWNFSFLFFSFLWGGGGRRGEGGLFSERAYFQGSLLSECCGIILLGPNCMGN